jgi:hypothetical protein
VIIQWKWREGLWYEATWQGIEFRLVEDVIRRRWYLFAGARRVNGIWPTAKAAMETVDAKQNKLIMQKARERGALTHAQQSA